MPENYRLLVGGEFRETSRPLEIRFPYDGKVAGSTFLAGDDEAETAVTAAVSCFEKTCSMPPFERAAVLEKIAAGLAARAVEIARTIAGEAGKPITAAIREVERSIFTFRYGAEEAKRIGGEIIPLDIHPLGKGHTAFVKRFPIGPVLGITPFNFPLNLVSHKVAPALAAGCPIVIKPATQTPLTALILAEIVMDSGWPAGGFSVLPCESALAEKMAVDERFKLLSFTGSPAVGWELKTKAGRKRVALELGGNAGVILHDDADIEDAAARITAGGFGYSGQTCISVQRVFVQKSVYRKFREIFLAKVRALKTGDPMNEATNVGPLISEKDAVRVESWIKEAVDGGAALLCGGEREGSIIQPAVLENTKPEMNVNCKEIFGPVVTLIPYDTIESAISAVNDSDYGLQAGIFTNNLKAAFDAWDKIEVGGVNVNNVPTFRIDHMPYGGVKLSGFGREGLRYAIKEMTELRNLVINRG